MAASKNIRLIVQIAMLVVFHGQAWAAAQQFECPKVLPESALKLESSTGVWKTRYALQLRLNSAAPTGGPPEQRADLAQFTTRATKTARIDIYDLQPPHPGGLWIKCGYGASNEITLHRQIDDAITQCTITQSKISPSDIEIVCR